MGRDRAAYMREYRAKVKTRTTDMTTVEGRMGAAFDLVKADLRIAELEAEVRHLKAELAKRPATHAYSSRPFTPVPKK